MKFYMESNVRYRNIFHNYHDPIWWITCKHGPSRKKMFGVKFLKDSPSKFWAGDPKYQKIIENFFFEFEKYTILYFWWQQPKVPFFLMQHFFSVFISPNKNFGMMKMRAEWWSKYAYIMVRNMLQLDALQVVIWGTFIGLFEGQYTSGTSFLDTKTKQFLRF